jgi:predicted phage terminase large subunit-like protein
MSNGLTAIRPGQERSTNTTLDKPLEPLAGLTEAQLEGVFADAIQARSLATKSLTPQQAAAITTARRIARKSFRWFIRYVTADDASPYELAPFHLSIIRELQGVFTGEQRRILLAAPPRHGKSKLCAILFPCFVLGDRPTARIIIAAYSQELAREHLREVRAVLLSSAFRELFPNSTLAEDGQAADLLRSTAGGSCRATGAGGTLTGLGADLLVLDDLIKGYDEAASELMRASLWAWYSTSARTRLSPKGAIVAIGTRWHFDDVLGRLIKASEDGTGEAWRDITFQAIDTQGLPLWGERFPLESLRSLKATLGQTQWQALFQGSPSPVGGGFFRADWFPYYSGEIPEKDLLHVVVTDFALSDAAGDWSVIALLSIDSAGKIFLRDLWRERVTMDKTVVALIHICKRWKPAAWCCKQDMIMKSALPLIRQRFVQQGISVWHIALPSSASKVQKAGALQDMRGERHSLPADAPWADELIAEMCAPAGQHDDQVDALAHLGRAWLKLRPRSETKTEPIPEGMCLSELWKTVRPTGKWTRV